MNAWRVGDLADDSVFLEIHHHHFHRMGKIQAMRGGIDAQNVPTALAPIGISVTSL